ncbi:uncharacterized protein LOC118382916 isoform X2 [Oncorhynchus keta]|uniref:uncharacterized protein LOC118382916 isoform X2 n=1 Tax=Oncorhynchus keta TaxID=8018 RepID=UPI00227BBF1A|nr:uncharacterized protein LOC118382916 isoform X2 [Oncorhynchus keta]XP_052373389.1 uncharacterized protein LOC118382916 isoform X2 [Oncorhynchus keta]XP_052373390.1 uncharacterized protein LOC118382916 isoform X2 [Oncorhynchus keta]XP_052373391.1 uncharacterized protein LOC118382916 isoform X2 [Oncorhynchus keta]XP_052373392.1 uncharacterized protein LOC118382916 isoform X2 [Oncorhynchus keta]XP_052373393.1 uncharacterized protein LOC118382916 isoform X2 [Oncorhynchus keta]XP_052373394.1 un
MDPLGTNHKDEKDTAFITVEEEEEKDDSETTVIDGEEESDDKAKETEPQQQKEQAWAPTTYSKFGKEVFCCVGQEISIFEALDSYGAVIWPAALALCHYLETNVEQLNLVDKAVLELGAGPGLVSIVATLLGAWVTATDLPEIIGNLRANLLRNTRGRCRNTPQAAALSWGPDVERIYPRSVYRYDYVLAADVVYHHDYLEELLFTMRYFCRPGTTLIWANKVRLKSFTENFQNTFNTTLLAEIGEVNIFMGTCRETEEKPELDPGKQQEEEEETELVPGKQQEEEEEPELDSGKQQEEEEEPELVPGKQQEEEEEPELVPGKQQEEEEEEHVCLQVEENGLEEKEEEFEADQTTENEEEDETQKEGLKEENKDRENQEDSQDCRDDESALEGLEEADTQDSNVQREERPVWVEQFVVEADTRDSNVQREERPVWVEQFVVEADNIAEEQDNSLEEEEEADAGDGSSQTWEKQMLEHSDEGYGDDDDEEAENTNSRCSTEATDEDIIEELDTKETKDTGDAQLDNTHVPWIRLDREVYFYAGHKINIVEAMDSHGGVIWPAALALCNYLETNTDVIDLKGKQVLELGSGTGLVSIVASLLGAQVTATDLPDVLSNLRYNLLRNTRGRSKYTPEVTALSWGPEVERTYPRSVYRYDYVLAADVVYHHDLEELLVTMKYFCRPGNTLIWANKVRLKTNLVFTEDFKNTFNTTLLAEMGEVKIFKATCKR